MARKKKNSTQLTYQIGEEFLSERRSGDFSDIKFVSIFVSNMVKITPESEMRETREYYPEGSEQYKRSEMKIARASELGITHWYGSSMSDLDLRFTFQGSINKKHDLEWYACKVDGFPMRRINVDTLDRIFRAVDKNGTTPDGYTYKNRAIDHPTMLIKALNRMKAIPVILESAYENGVINPNRLDGWYQERGEFPEYTAIGRTF